MRRNAALFGMPALLIAALAITVLIHPTFSDFDLESLAMGALPLAFAAAAQAVVVIAGGIDLSIGSMIAVANVLAARSMENASFEQSLLLAVVVLLAGAAMGAVNGLIVVFSRVPDVVATLTSGFIWGGVALLILEKPGGGAPPEFLNLGAGTTFSTWLPNGLILLALSVAAHLDAVVSVESWDSSSAPSEATAMRRSAAALASDGRGSRPTSFQVCSVRSAGLALTMTTGIGSPLAGVYYTLSGLAAIVVGGVSLAGGRGGVVGPVLAAFVLTLIPADLIFLNIDPNFGQVIQGVLIVAIVMISGLPALIADTLDNGDPARIVGFLIRRRRRSVAAAASHDPGAAPDPRLLRARHPARAARHRQPHLAVEHGHVRGATRDHGRRADARDADRRNRPFGGERCNGCGLLHGDTFVARRSRGGSLRTRRRRWRRRPQWGRRRASSRPAARHDAWNRPHDRGHAGRLQPEDDGRRTARPAVHR